MVLLVGVGVGERRCQPTGGEGCWLEVLVKAVDEKGVGER